MSQHQKLGYTAASHNLLVFFITCLQLHGGRSGIEGPGLSQNQKLGYAAAFVGLPYLWLRLQRLAAQREWGYRQDDRLGLAAWRLLRGADAAHKVGQLLNLWVFLYQGKYRCVDAAAVRIVCAWQPRFDAAQYCGCW
jgi:hypothetical protein